MWFKSSKAVLLVLIKRRPIVTVGPIFNLYTKFTAVILLTFCALLGCKELLIKDGKPIVCSVLEQGTKDIYGGKDMKKVINSYCWISTTFLVPKHGEFQFKSGPVASAHPGLTNHRGVIDSDVKYYAYYQWVTFALFFQAWFCYLPWVFWKHWENGLMRTIVMGLDMTLREKADVEQREEKLIKYLIQHLNLHSYYSCGYWIAEVFCFLGIVLQMFLLDWFFDGEFRNYGFNVLGLLELGDENLETRFDPFIYIFPRVTKCTFSKFGHSGSITTHDAICVLSLNNTNEKIYIFIWFWYISLALLSALVLLYRILIILLPSLRQYLLYSRNRMVPKETASLIAKISASDWWIFYMLGRNMDPVHFSQVAIEFGRQVTVSRLENNNPLEFKEIKLL